jgi:hypothetical protein
MSEKYLCEMVADWWGAGRAITGKWDAVGWYSKQSQIQLHERTRAGVESLLAVTDRHFNPQPQPIHLSV